ncbi:MAG: tRNA-intron lyase [Candidatus Micrarchaeota archaeon]
MPLLIGERVLVTEPELVEDFDKRGYGEKEEGSKEGNSNQLLLSPEEALYMVEKKKDFVIKSATGKAMDYEKLWKHFMKIDKDFPRKYIVYRDMKDRGFCIKTGFKFGSHFRIYSRGDKPGKGHAIWLMHCIPEEYTVELAVFARAIRLAQNVRKKMIYAVVDKEGDITYYKFDRITP